MTSRCVLTRAPPRLAARRAGTAGRDSGAYKTEAPSSPLTSGLFETLGDKFAMEFARLVSLLLAGCAVATVWAQEPVNPNSGLTAAEEIEFLKRHNDYRREYALKYTVQNMNALVSPIT